MKRNSHTVWESAGRGKILITSKGPFEQNIISLEPDLWKVSETLNSENTNRHSSLSIPEWGWNAGPFPKWFFPSKFFSLEYTFCWNSVASNTCSHSDATAKSCVPQEVSPSRSGQFSPYYLFMRVNFMCWHFTRHMGERLPEPSCRQLSAAFYFFVVVLNSTARDWSKVNHCFYQEKWLHEKPQILTSHGMGHLVCPSLGSGCLVPQDAQTDWPGRCSYG